jgi:hypothetical protein
MRRLNQAELLALLIALGIGIALFTPIMHHWRLMGDYPVHDELALRLIENPSDFFRNTPHFLYHVFTAIMYLIVPGGDVYVAGVRVMVLAYLALIALIFWVMLQSYPNNQGDRRRPIILFGVTIALMLAVPISIITPDNLYLGYFFSHVYHNPTVNLMKPFALGLFLLALSLFGDATRIHWRWIPAYLAVTALGMVAKPSFILSFVPALALITLYYLLGDLRENWRSGSGSLLQRLRWLLFSARINWAVLMLGIVFPAMAILVVQALTWTSSGGISIEPFRTFFEWTLHYDPNADKNLLLKLLMSIAFPLTITLLYARQALTHRMLNLAWINFILSAAYAYLLVDRTVIAAGDFGWSAQMAVLLLYISAAQFLLQTLKNGMPDRGQRVRLALCLIVFGLHIISGIYWYYLHLTGDAIELLYGVW